MRMTVREDTVLITCMHAAVYVWLHSFLSPVNTLHLDMHDQYIIIYCICNQDTKLKIHKIQSLTCLYKVFTITGMLMSLCLQWSILTFIWVMENREGPLGYFLESGFYGVVMY